MKSPYYSFLPIYAGMQPAGLLSAANSISTYYNVAQNIGRPAGPAALCIIYAEAVKGSGLWYDPVYIQYPILKPTYAHEKINGRPADAAGCIAGDAGQNLC